MKLADKSLNYSNNSIFLYLLVFLGCILLQLLHQWNYFGFESSIKYSLWDIRVQTNRNVMARN